MSVLNKNIMKKLLKIILILTFLALIIITGAGFYLVKNGKKILTENKPRLEAEVSKTLGTSVKLGDFDFSIFPVTKINFKQIAVGKTAIIKSLKLQDLILKINLKALLDKKLEITKFSIQNANITLPAQTLTNVDVVSKIDFQQNLLKLQELKVAGKLNGLTDFNVKVPILNFNLKNQDLELNDILANLFSGVIKANINNNLKSKSLSTNLTVTDIDLAAAQQALQAESKAKIEGNLDSFTLNLSGNTDKIPGSLNGQGNLLLTKGTLKGTNIASKTLSLIKDLPFITGSLLDAVPESLIGEVDGEDTPIREMKLDYSLNNAILNAKSFSLLSSIFDLNGRGTIGLDQTLNLEAEILFHPEFSRALANKVKEIEQVLAKDGRLIIPLKIQGKAKDLKITPNLKKLIEVGATKMLEEKVKEKVTDKLNEKAGKFLEKAFGF